MDGNRTRGAFYSLNYHLVWCPKYRCGVLSGQVTNYLQALSHEIASQYEFQVFAYEVMPDQVHLFVAAPPEYSPSALAKLFKGITSHHFHQESGEQLCHKVWKPGPRGFDESAWSPSFCVGTAGNVSGDVIKRYIEECQHI